MYFMYEIQYLCCFKKDPALVSRWWFFSRCLNDDEGPAKICPHEVSLHSKRLIWKDSHPQERKLLAGTPGSLQRSFTGVGTAERCQQPPVPAARRASALGIYAGSSEVKSSGGRAGSGCRLLLIRIKLKLISVLGPRLQPREGLGF